MDVNSFSYNYGEYDAFHKKYPFRTIIGGESASCTSDRGRYLGRAGGHSNDTMGWVDGSDTGCVVSAWGTSAAVSPWVVGNFAWTGWDYKGEPTPSSWPAINSHFGIIDIAGFPKDGENCARMCLCAATYLLPHMG
jgi:beta-galactosidase